MKIKTTLTTLALVFALSASTFANGLSLNSVGTRALGMGGAFVGLANDGTAIYWNPAGLTTQGSSVMGYFTGITPYASYKMDLANIDAKTNSKIYTAPGLFANYRTGKWAFGLGVYVPAGLGAEWNATDFMGAGAEGKDFLSQIGVISFSPAVAYQVTDQLSLGLALNVYYGLFDMSQPVDASSIGGGIEQFSESSNGTGISITFGLKYQFSDAFSAGLSFRTSTKVAMSGDATNTMFPKIPNMPPYAPGPESSSFSRDVTWPMWLAGGIAYKPMDVLTITVDGQYNQWSKLEKLTAVYDDPYWNQMMTAGGDDEFELKWEDALQIRLGAEYMASKTLALRVGYYYDPAPAPDENLNVLFPSSTNHVVTGGLTYKMGNVCLIGGMEYLFGAERDIDMNATNEMPGLHQMDVFAFSVGIGYKF